jgi:hypothetical protein
MPSKGYLYCRLSLQDNQYELLPKSLKKGWLAFDYPIIPELLTPTYYDDTQGFHLSAACAFRLRTA